MGEGKEWEEESNEEKGKAAQVAFWTCFLSKDALRGKGNRDLCSQSAEDGGSRPGHLLGLGCPKSRMHPSRKREQKAHRLLQRTMVYLQTIFISESEIRRFYSANSPHTCGSKRKFLLELDNVDFKLYQCYNLSVNNCANTMSHPRLKITSM